MQNVESAPRKNVRTNSKASCGEVNVFYNIPKKGLKLNQKQINSINICRRRFLKQLQCGQPANLNPVQGLASWLALFPKCDHRDLITCLGKQTCLVGDASVLRKVVLN